MSLAVILAAAVPRDDGFAATIPLDWHQGRTSYGGLSAALALSAATRVGGELPPLRSAQVSMIGPLARNIEVSARVLRRGRNATWVGAEIASAAGPGLTATFVFMAPGASAVRVDDLPPPERLIAPAEARALGADRGATFLRHHFDVRFALARGEAKRPEMCWWVRPRERAGLAPAVEALLVGDALPPGVMPLLDAAAPASTMQWQLTLLTSEPATDDWWLLRSTAEHADHGCSHQRMTMWNSAGEPVAAGVQSFALFG